MSRVDLSQLDSSFGVNVFFLQNFIKKWCLLVSVDGLHMGQECYCTIKT